MGAGEGRGQGPGGAGPAEGAAGSSPGEPRRCPRALPACPAEHKLLSAGPTEPWSIREKLCLASSVMRSGDQNWYGSGKGGRRVHSAGGPGQGTGLSPRCLCSEQTWGVRGVKDVPGRAFCCLHNYCVKVEVY